MGKERKLLVTSNFFSHNVFLLNQIIVSPFVHIFDIISLFAAELEDCFFLQILCWFLACKSITSVLKSNAYKHRHISYILKDGQILSFTSRILYLQEYIQPVGGLDGNTFRMLVCLIFQLSQHNKELANLLKPSGDLYGDQALEFYAKHTAQIEVGLLLTSQTLFGIAWSLFSPCSVITKF